MCLVCKISPNVVRQYHIFGNILNLLHAGVCYSRLWQSGLYDDAIDMSDKNSCNEACSAASINRSKIGSIEEKRLKMSSHLKNRGGAADLSGSALSIQPSNRVTNFSWPSDAGRRNLNSDMRMKPVHLQDDGECSRNRLGKYRLFGRLRTSFRYVYDHT